MNPNYDAMRPVQSPAKVNDKAQPEVQPHEQNDLIHHERDALSRKQQSEDLQEQLLKMVQQGSGSLPRL